MHQYDKCSFPSSARQVTQSSGVYFICFAKYEEDIEGN